MSEVCTPVDDPLFAGVLRSKGFVAWPKFSANHTSCDFRKTKQFSGSCGFGHILILEVYGGLVSRSKIPLVCFFAFKIDTAPGSKPWV